MAGFLKNKSIIYVSTNAKSLSLNDVTDIVLTSQQRNRENLITGFLTYHFGMFMQYIEGPHYNVDALMKNLRGDKRHRILSEVELDAFEKPLFDGWNMRWDSELEPDISHARSRLESELLRQRRSPVDHDLEQFRVSRLLHEMAEAVRGTVWSKNSQRNVAHFSTLIQDSSTS